MKSKRGFTLVELSLSLVFIGILSITIALIINNAINTYRRGLTLNQINTVGMDLVDDMQAVIQNSPANIANDTCKEGGSSYPGCLQNYISVVENATIELENNEIEVPIYGAFCTGAYSYIWNSGYFFNGSLNVDKAELEGYSEDIRLLKVKDKKRAICSNRNDNKFSLGDDSSESGEASELLSASENEGLALYDLSVPLPAMNNAGSTKQAFYSVSFILGTVQGGINVMSSGNFCTAPKGQNSNFNYCAINKFNFAAQANGG